MFLLFLLICFKQTKQTKKKKEKNPSFIQAFTQEQKKVIIQHAPGAPRLPAKPGNLAKPDSLILEAGAGKRTQEKHLRRATWAFSLWLLTST